MSNRDYKRDEESKPSSSLFYAVAGGMIATNWACCFLVMICTLKSGPLLHKINAVVTIGALASSFPACIVAVLNPFLVPLAAIPNAIGWAYFVTVMHARSKAEYRRRT